MPAIVFVFGREQCFEVARLLKSCRRFTTDEERAQVDALCDEALLPGGAAKELRPLLAHGIGVHHAGILPRYKQLVEELALERLIKFVVSTETIAAGINLPARTVVFPSLRKFIKKEPRLVTAAEYHQMAGRAGRPQFDDRGLAITLAPEEVVSEIKKELKARRSAAACRRRRQGQESPYRICTSACCSASAGRPDLDAGAHAELVRGEPAELRAKTKITAEQVLAIGLPDLTTTKLPGADGYVRRGLDEVEASAAAVDAPRHDDGDRQPAARPIASASELHKTLAQLVDNMKAIGVIDEHGKQVSGEMIRELQGMDGLLHLLRPVQPPARVRRAARSSSSCSIDHDIVQRMLDRKGEDEKREWCARGCASCAIENRHVTWEDVEAEWREGASARADQDRDRSTRSSSAKVPHPELHGGKKPKSIWAQLEDAELGFLEFVEKHGLEHEEGNLFSYLVRVMNFARKLGEASQLSEFGDMADRVKAVIGSVDIRHAG